MSDEDPCYRCGRPSDLLCDFVIAREKTGEVFHKADLRNPVQRWSAVTGQGARIFTCDRPMCRACASNRGATFYDGETPSIETIDYCHEHVGQDDSYAPIITAEDVEAVRLRMAFRISHPAPEPPRCP